MLKLKNKDFSRDPKAVAALNNDPLIAHEVQPALTVAALARGRRALRKSFATITLPVLIMHGTADKATVCHGSEFFYEHAGSKDKTLKLYEGHFHDLLADVGKEEVIADITGWIEARLPARLSRRPGGWRVLGELPHAALSFHDEAGGPTMFREIRSPGRRAALLIRAELGDDYQLVPQPRLSRRKSLPRILISPSAGTAREDRRRRGLP